LHETRKNNNNNCQTWLMMARLARVALIRQAVVNTFRLLATIAMAKATLGQCRQIREPPIFQ
jgi:hypothetical protein